MKDQTSQTNKNLPSAINPWVVTAGFIAFLVTLITFKYFQLLDNVKIAVALILATAGVNFGFDLLVVKVHLRPSAGLNWNQDNFSLRRTAIKYLGLLGSLGFVSLLYWIFPEYSGEFYYGFKRMIALTLPWFLILALPYIAFVDSRMKNPQDSYYEFGQCLLLKFEKSKFPQIKQHLLGWLIKGFFIPLMFTYFINDVQWFMDVNVAHIQSFQTFFDFSHRMVFLVDVGLGTTGYIMSLRLFDTHLRSAEPTMTGWASAIICYQPFYSIVARYFANYGGPYNWTSWLGAYPTLYVFWGCMILFLYGIYAWATIIFGCRFSNLTHRGIITNGPYAYLKHPAFVAKNLSWWFVALPMLSTVGGLDAIKRCLMLLMLNSVYYIRAKTEERHLSQDPDYVAYSNHMDDKYNRVWARLRTFWLY